MAKPGIRPEPLPGNLRQKIQLFATNYLKTIHFPVSLANLSTDFLVFSLSYRRRYMASALEAVCINQSGTQVDRDGHRRMILKWMSST